MAWTSSSNRLLRYVNADDDALLNEAQDAFDVSDALGGKRDVVIRLRLEDGRAAWCTRFNENVGLVAVAPWGSLFDSDEVGRDDFFADRWPKAWMSKNTVPRVDAGERPEGQLEPGGWCWRMAPDGGVIFGRLVSVAPDGEAVSVMLDKDGTTQTADAGRWRMFNKFQDGLEALFDDGRTWFDNYRFMCMIAGRAHKERNGGIEYKERKRTDRALKSLGSVKKVEYVEGPDSAPPTQPRKAYKDMTPEEQKVFSDALRAEGWRQMPEHTKAEILALAHASGRELDPWMK